MNSSRGKIWFPAKTHGYGWGLPVCWQGWVVIAVYFALLVGGSMAIRSEPRHAPWFALYAIGLSLALIFVCWLKGEKPG